MMRGYNDYILFIFMFVGYYIIIFMIIYVNDMWMARPYVFLYSISLDNHGANNGE